MEKAKVSIIIPVYNAEKTIQNCLDSINAQKYPYLQCIFVNDCSVDNSVQKIEKFSELFEDNLYKEVIIVNHEINKGVASARNSGLELATGEYIYFLDADDELDADAISLMVEQSKRFNNDIVGINWYLKFDVNEKMMSQPKFSSSREALILMMSGIMRWNLWLFLFRRTLFSDNNIKFVDGQNMGEDMLVVFELFMCANSVSYLDKALYHYGQSNAQSLTKVYSAKHIEEVSLNVKDLERKVLGNQRFENLAMYINLLKLNVKLPLIIGEDTSQFELWNAWFPESNAYIWKNNHLPFRTKLLQWLAFKKQYILLKLYYKVVIKFVYGVIYK